MKVQHFVVLAALLGVCCAFIVPQSDGSLTMVSPIEKFSTDAITVNGKNLYTELTSVSTYTNFVRPLFLSNFDSLIYQYISAYSPKDSIVVTVNGTTFMFIANGIAGQSQPIYKWNSATESFSFFSNVAVTMNYNEDYEGFQWGGNYYLSISNRESPSFLLRFDGTTWPSVESVIIPAVYDSAFFTINTTSYVAYASNTNVHVRMINSSGLVAWTNSYTISGTNGKDVEPFSIGGNYYLACVFAAAVGTVEIYQWNGAGFTQLQVITTTSPNSAKFFTVSTGASFLAIAEGPITDTNSEIYQWNGTAFTLYQTIATTGAYDMDTFTMGGDTYLVISSYSSASKGFYADSLLYKFNGYMFSKVSTITSRGATSARKFTISGNDYIFMTNNGTDTQNSYLYKLTF